MDVTFSGVAGEVEVSWKDRWLFPRVNSSPTFSRNQMNEPRAT